MISKTIYGDLYCSMVLRPRQGALLWPSSSCTAPDGVRSHGLRRGRTPPRVNIFPSRLCSELPSLCKLCLLSGPAWACSLVYPPKFGVCSHWWVFAEGVDWAWTCGRRCPWEGDGARQGWKENGAVWGPCASSPVQTQSSEELQESGFWILTWPSKSLRGFICQGRTIEHIKLFSLEWKLLSI